MAGHEQAGELRLVKAIGTTSRRIAAGVSILGLLWIFLIYWYFIRTNLALIYNEQFTFGVFSALLGKYTFSWDNCPPPEILEALIVLLITQLFGWLVVDGLAARFSLIEKHILAFPIGFGLSGIAFELLTMAHGLYLLPSWGLWIVMLVAAWWLRVRAGHGGDAEVVQDAPSLPLPHLPRFPAGLAARATLIVMFTLLLLTTITTFWHGLFFPEVYWDSLILYLGYGRMTFLQHAFPFKAEAQVGIGLGANYPHLYSTFGAMASTMFGHWSDVHQRLAAPFAGVVACGLIYATSLRLWRNHLIAAATALLFRSMPYAIAYTTQASDYAFAMLFCAAFAHLMTVFCERPSRGALALFTMIPAISMHLNYLMGIIWIPWLIVILAKCGIMPIFRSRIFWGIYLLGIVLALPWYIRNYALTGNPVYSFFPEIFKSSIRINTEVLRSAEVEWFRNGDGIGRLGELYHDLKTGRQRNEGDAGYKRMATFGDRIAASWLFWIGFDVFTRSDHPQPTLIGRLLHLANIADMPAADSFGETSSTGLMANRQAYKMAPAAAGFFVAAMMATPLVFIVGRKRRIVIVGMLLTVGSLLGYHYFLADFYLYQIIAMVGPGIVLCGIFPAMAALSGKLRKPLVGIFCALVIAQGVSPGLAFGLLNFKFFEPKEIDGQFFSPFALDAFRNPGMPKELFYRLRFGDDVAAWDYVNEHFKGEHILTHENRHYVIDPSITLIHLDDWDMQSGYDLPTAEATAKLLREHGIRHYWRVANEANHAVNARLGMQRLIDAGLAKEVFRSGDNVIYEIKPE